MTRPRRRARTGNEKKAAAPVPASPATAAPARRRVVLAALALAALAGLAVALFLVESAPDRPKHIVLVTLDTLRADRLGCYGYRAARTPRLDALAREGILFRSAVAQVPLTLPSHTSLFTGAYPVRHGVRDNGVPFERDDLRTIAEIAKERGFRTAAFVSAFVLDSKWGLDRGFDTYHDRFELSRYERISLGSVERRADETLEAVLPWLEAAGPARFFLWVHFYDPHAPYDPPEPFRGPEGADPYDGEVAAVDAAVGRILDALDELGLASTTAVLVVGDHGEGLGDHRELTHGNFVYESTLRVPLIVRLPGGRGAGTVVDEPVGVLDLFPTLAELFDAPVPPQAEGRSLLALLDKESRADFADRALLAESYYPRFHYGWSEVLAVRTARYKLIDTPRAELYDLEADPAEETNLVAERPRLVAQLRERLEAIVGEGARPAAAPRATDAETERRLRALGYVAAAAVPADVDRHELPDPKDKIDVIHAIARVDALGESGEHEEAIRLLEEILATDPQIVDAHLSLGNKLTALGRYEEAIEAFRRCLEINPDYGLARVNLAIALRRAGRLDEAKAAFEAVLETDPENRQAYFHLGEIALFRQDYGAALALFRKGLELEPDSAVFLRQVGIAEYYLGDLDAAETSLRAALRARADLAEAHYLLGLVYEAARRPADAEAAYRAELERDPAHRKAAVNLASLYERAGRHDERIAVLEELVRRDPDWATGHVLLAKAYRDANRPELYEKALASAARGLALEPEGPSAPLAYFLRAELFDRLGRKAEARRAFEAGRALEAAARRKP